MSNCQLMRSWEFASRCIAVLVFNLINLCLCGLINDYMIIRFIIYVLGKCQLMTVANLLLVFNLISGLISGFQFASGLIQKNHNTALKILLKKNWIVSGWHDPLSNRVHRVVFRLPSSQLDRVRVTSSNPVNNQFGFGFGRTVLAGQSGWHEPDPPTWIVKRWRLVTRRFSHLHIFAMIANVVVNLNS